MEINSLIKNLEDKLKKNFIINNLKIEDKSFLHKKHKNFSKDKFHIMLTIESLELKKISSLEANRKIYTVLKEEMNGSIHSLQITIV
jgi:BolA protein|tara:strand:+ start:192 stop:452 length:261 start_codon:yes stop_codon:yes gene_type:complete